MKKTLGGYLRTLENKYKKLTPTGRMRSKAAVGIILLALGGLYATTYIFGAASDITGVVFHDYNGNGKRDNMLGTNPTVAADRGVAGVTVRGYGANGALCDTATTDANGTYALSVSNCVGQKFRVEFVGLPNGYSSTQVGDDSKTTVQFVGAGGVANLGIYRDGDYCQNNPRLVTSCIKAGPYNGDEYNEDTILGFMYNASGTAAPSLRLGTYAQVGTTYAQAFRPVSQYVYSSAYMRRHDGFGPGGPGAIYKALVPASFSGTSSSNLAVTIPNAGADPHPVSDNNCNSLSGQSSTARSNCWAHDQFSFDAAGKISLGGMALASDSTNPSNDALLVVNLNDRQIYKVTKLDNAPISTGYGMPLSLPNSGSGALPAGAGAGQHQGCANSDVRPFAVTVHNGTGYAGLVCSAQTSRNSGDLRAYVYSFDPKTMAFATVPLMEFPLNYDRSCAYGVNAACNARATWIPWISQFTDPLISTGAADEGERGKPMSAPQPILSDITFTDNGSLTLGLRDRYSDQLGYLGQSTNPNNTQRYTVQSAGDTLRACLVNGTYILESGGKCDGKGPGSSGVHAVASNLPQGIGGYEFYSSEYFSNTNGQVLTQDETSGGALAQVPGFDSFASTATSPLDGNTLGGYSGGIRQYSSETAARTNSYRLYQNQLGDSYLKGSALGDVTAICDTAPIEVGNRVWKDSNGNGIQDSEEPGIGGITVTLRNSANAVIATALTDADGNYTFSSRKLDENGQTMVSTPSKRYGIAGLTANTANFKVSLNTAADYTDPARLMGLNLTPANVTANYGNDQNDSDATAPDAAAKLSVNNPAVIAFATGAAGVNNHTLDFGFSRTASIGNFVWLDSNKDGRVSGTEATLGINGVTVSLYPGTADTNNDGKLSASELAAASVIATQVTANDVRPGSTSGRPGYYQFDGLVAGDYFVSIGSSNFSAGQPLAPYTNVPVPAGVGDTQDDNTNHGEVPLNGTLAANGVVSTKINLQPGAEPTNTSAKPDDDASNDTDTTIDFGFWHSYSLGNRVWLDKDGSATINAADGATPGVGGVQVNLLAGNGSFIKKMNTDAAGYYRFDDLNAGTYIVEIPASNFATSGTLKDHPVSSVGPGQEADPDSNGDSNDNGINTGPAGGAVRSGTVTLGPGPSEPIGETDLSSSGQGTTDAFANMTVDFGFVGNSSLGDTVYYDLNGNASQDTGEPGIPNVTVTLVCGGPDGKLSTPADNTTATMKTDANGNYLFSNLNPGECKATVTTGDVPGAVLTTAASYTHTMVSDESFLDADFGFKASGVIGNQVWKELFNDGTYNPALGDTAVSGVNIELYRDLNGNGVVDDTDTLMATKTTDSNGRYQFGGLPVDDNIAANGPGAQYVIKLVDPNNHLNNLQWSVGPNPGADNNSQTPSGYGMVLTPSAPNNQTGDFGYHGVAAVGDTVYYDQNANGVQEPGDSVIPGVTVTLTYPGPDNDCQTINDNITRSMVTDANGLYMFTNLLGGKYCISIVPPAGTTVTTNNQGQAFSLAPTQTDLTRDFGVVGDGTIGNQVFIDYNANGRFDAGDNGISDVTLDLYRDTNGNGAADAGEPVIKSTTTNADGQYEFKQLMTSTNGVKYVVAVTDTGHKLSDLTHVMGTGLADNESKPPAGYGLALTVADNHHPEADFGYKANPVIVTPPDFWKKQVVDHSFITYTLTWINLSAVNAMPTSFTDAIPVGTAYVADSLTCQPKGSSMTAGCVYNPAFNRIEWKGTVGADVGHTTPDLAVNPIVVSFKVQMATTTMDVSNQAFGVYGVAGPSQPVPSDDIDTPQIDDANLYHRSPEKAAIAVVTDTILANTGQAIVFSAIAALLVIVGSVASVIITRRRRHW